MAGYTFNIGINYCDSFDLADCELDGAVGDAIALRDFAVGAGFQPWGGDGLLLESAATRSGILASLEAMRGTVQEGDFVILTFSGLGIPVDFAEPDPPGQRAWITIDPDGIYLGELPPLLAHAIPGARVLIVSAACFSGPVSQQSQRLRVISNDFLDRMRSRFRALNLDSSILRGPYGPISSFSTEAGAPATIVHLAACGLGDRINDGSIDQRSPFVASLIRTVSDGQKRNFDEFLIALRNDVKEPQPQLEPPVVSDQLFRRLGPFRLPT